MYEFLEYQVEDFMTFPPIAIRPNATLLEAQQVFETHEFNCLPVTENDRLVGILTKLDFLKAFAFSPGFLIPPYRQIMRQKVSTFMNPEPTTVSTDAPLTRVLQKMVETRYKSFPVVRGKELVGIIAREDIARALRCAAAGEGTKALGGKMVRGKSANGRGLIREVGRRLECGAKRAEALAFAVFQELRDRLTPKEAADVAAQLPTILKRMWQEQERPGRRVRRIRKEEFLGRVRRRAGLADDGEAEKAVRAVFKALQRLLGSSTGKEGEAWDVFSQLPKDLKILWIQAGERPSA